MGANFIPAMLRLGIELALFDNTGILVAAFVAISNDGAEAKIGVLVIEGCVVN